MIDRHHPGADCTPTDNPARQPNPPGDTCDAFDDPKPPELKPPAPCPPPDSGCKCPTGPSAEPNCLENLIAKKSADIAAGDKAKAFKTELEALQGKAKAAAQEYTKDKYDKLLKLWVDQDKEIAELIRKLVCAVPCWRCIIECHVCPLLNRLRDAEKWLWGDGTLYAEVKNLHDLLHWHARNKEAMERRFLRIKSVLVAWEKPAQTIEKVLADNKKLTMDSGQLLGSDPAKVVYDVFLRLVPMHLAIAPPAGPDRKTLIDKKYTEFCKCDEPEEDACCGPDVGDWTFRQRLIGPQPYLIDPGEYVKLICCLVDKRYGPAQDAWTRAESDYLAVDDQIKRYKAQIDGGLKTFDKDAKGAIPSSVDCCDYDKHEGDTDSPASAR